jgi:hypothetical protein
MESPRPANLADDSYRLEDGRMMFASLSRVLRRNFTQYLQVLAAGPMPLAPVLRSIPVRVLDSVRHERG